MDGAQVIDCFCGTGALGLEALSRGAAFCTFVDSARASLDLAKDNAKMLGAEAAAFLLKDAAKLPPRPEDTAPVTLVFLDPPYRKNLVVPVLEALMRGGWLAAGALCVIETEKDWDEGVPEGVEELSVKMYGETKVTMTIRSEAPYKSSRSERRRAPAGKSQRS